MRLRFQRNQIAFETQAMSRTERRTIADNLQRKGIRRSPSPTRGNRGQIHLPNGKYLVKLHFSETFAGITAPRERIFSFSGVGKAHIETVPVEIKDGRLDITFTSNIENPQINGIEIIAQCGARESRGRTQIVAG